MTNNFVTDENKKNKIIETMNQVMEMSIENEQEVEHTETNERKEAT